MSLLCALEVCESNNHQAMANVLAKVASTGADALFILACEADNWTPETADAALHNATLPVFGAVFPRVIKGEEAQDSGTWVLGLKGHFEPFIVRRLSMGESVLKAQIAELQPALNRFRSLIVLPDGLGKNIERLVEVLYSALGSHCTAVGGGAGSLDFIQKPCLFTNEGMLADAALLVATDRRVAVGVNHGWETLEGPILVTGSSGNTLEYLNYQPAFDVYKNIVESHCGIRFCNHDFFDIAKTYPLGIAGVDGEILVRDPIKLDGNSLVCVGEVPINSTVYLLQGSPSQLINASAAAAEQARATTGKAMASATGSALVFDCISRSLFLDGEFHRELQAIGEALGENTNVLGALTLGEICQSPHGPIQLLNKSTVIAFF